jgi:hypothetical protein
MEFRASDMDKPWRLSRTEPTTREAGLKGLRGLKPAKLNAMITCRAGSLIAEISGMGPGNSIDLPTAVYIVDGSGVRHEP